MKDLNSRSKGAKVERGEQLKQTVRRAFEEIFEHGDVAAAMLGDSVHTR